METHDSPVRLKPSHLHYTKWYVISLALLAAGAWGLLNVPDFSLSAFFLVGVGVVLAAGTVLARHSHTFIVTSHHIIRQFSFISHRTSEVRLNQVTELHLKQGLLGRLLNVGSVHINTMSAAEDMSFFGVRSPKKVREAIQERSISMTRTPLQILQERLAKGEISADEFAEKKAHL